MKICVSAPFYIGEDWQHMREQCRWFGGMVRQPRRGHRRQHGADGAVPKALTDYIEGRTGHDYNTHGRADNDHVDFVPGRDRRPVLRAGTAADHIAKLAEELASLGVDHFAGYLQHDNKEETLRVYGETVIPALAGRARAKS